MGYHVCRFISQVDQNIICSICSAVLEEAVVTPCGHSFCNLCLNTWLARPNPKTCPECRTPIMSSNSIHPIHAIRNLINGLDIACNNKERGCLQPQKIDKLKTHESVCGLAPVECMGCGVIINRKDLAEHHLKCEVIQSIAMADDNSLLISSNIERRMSAGVQKSLQILNDENSNDVDQGISKRNNIDTLYSRVSTLEIEIHQIRRDLDRADHKNKRMERELHKTRKELQEKKQQLNDQQYIEFDPDYEYGYTSESILKLSSFISRFLNRKPQYVDTNKIFKAIQRCVDNFGHKGEKQRDDIHMLLATAYASNWLTRSQRVSVHCWIEHIIGVVNSV